MLIKNHTDANKREIKGYSYLEDIFGFCKSFKKLTKNLCFHLMLKIADLRDIIYKSMTNDISVTNNNWYIFKTILIPSVETQIMFNGDTQNNHMISCDGYFTERRVISDLLVQHDIGSVQQVNSPEYLIPAQQTKDRNDTPNKNNNIAIIDDLDLRKKTVELDGQRYPRDGLPINYTAKDYIDQYRDLKLFFKEYIGEPILNPLISYPDMKTKFSIGVIDLSHQSDLITSDKFQLFQEDGTDPDNARLSLILIGRREIELICDGKKLIEVKVI